MSSGFTFIICCPYHDNGIKSLGSKCLYKIKKQTILEKQCKSIAKFCNNIDYEIILINSIDHNKTLKLIENKIHNIHYKYLEYNNINYAGSMIEGLRLAKYETVYIIESGLILSAHSLVQMQRNNNDCDINLCGITNKHQQFLDLDTGCVTENDLIVTNIFFGLENKTTGLYCINGGAKSFMLNNFTIDKDGNKFIFELINVCISKNLKCKRTQVKNTDTYLIFNKKTLQEYIG